MPLPDSLIHKIALFRSRAALPNYPYGLFSRDSWLSVLVGQGVTPQGHDRLADAYALPVLEERLAEFRQRIQTNVAAMPTHADFIAEYCRLGEQPLSQEVAV
jgi:tryptophan halogenase